ncbi:cytochrome bd-I ubiquinol oxidase subunit 2 apoprotein [Saccharopolyspora erythraea NRRL 2338]|uniref:Cytochrome d ubiquinol oxidase subunit II n=2 Tax=Saccharopolyspora erythraea TaxID=1836 RepID=A4FDV9_SACEN|nr:cytochrome d ubiquinol oxidase subunit II [Saccharopolyspora erythraea]EQD82250.1 cytochrome D ubiquinol oxidase subunit II [Saccharopolyspora erythraea D]PFG95964.1 cytochrome bd-I ubiquinol oxidase subunit 2 apoprotein [Saccharopolyspora erythraea NRRL 2338]QRK92528.1 cytochrome d ubiquinol oxidase subunit II [Saccharopolyspora erythraea]CAM02234.1 cytochrome d ubiquinol oxidase subunit II [Saccharopolyspora erythraea NRRL 2338]
MTAADAVLAVLWIGLTLYVLFGGADFGGGLWDLLAGGAERGRPQRELIEHSIGPVWEANHVWLIFVITLFWTVFPAAFAPFAATLYIPLTLAALGIIARGAAFAFRKVSDEFRQRRLFGAAFAFSSVVTPFFLGTLLGAVASGRVPPDLASGDVLTSWWNPTSVTAGVLAVVTTAYLAAVFLTADARREREPELASAFRLRALVSGVVLGMLTLAALPVVRVDAPHLFAGLTGKALPLVVTSVVAGLLSLALLLARRYLLVRITAAVAVTAVLWAWGVAQYPVMLPGVTVADAAAAPSVLVPVLWVLAVGSVLLVPSLLYLYAIFQRDPARAPGASAGHG